MMSIDVVWWESSITDHQLYTLKELSCLQGVNLRVFALRSEANDRKKQGWTSSDLSLVNGKVIGICPLIFIIRLFYRDSNSSHVFGGPFDSWLITLALFVSLIRGKKTFVLTEPFSPISAGLLNDNRRFLLPFIGMLRSIKHRILWMCIRSRVDGVFAISRLAITQLKRFGVHESKLFPFGYFVPAISVPSSDTTRVYGDVIKLIFVGTINKTKGIDLAVTAIDVLNRMGRKISLDVYGPGDVGQLGLPKSRVTYKGMIQFGHSQSVIADYDCLILPSRYDGWGVAVNEALLAGVPVICSKQVGSSVLIDKWRCGAVFDNSVKDSLLSVLEDLCDRRAILLNEWRFNTELVRNTISPSVGALYISDVLFGRFDHNANGISSAYQ